MEARVAAAVGSGHGCTVPQQHLGQSRVAILAGDDEGRVAKLIAPVHRAPATQQLLCLQVLAVPAEGEQLPEISGCELPPGGRGSAGELGMGA